MVADAAGRVMIRPRVVRRATRSRRSPARRRPGRLNWVAIGVVLLVAAALRLAAVDRLSPHPDEPASILAARMVAERGVPVLPSGVLYLHGATLSYLLAPFVWSGAGDLADLATMRVLSAAMGAGAVLMISLLARRMSGLAWVGILAGWLLAIDPPSVQWSGHVRMYALLQCLTIAVAWMFWRAVSDSPRRAPLVWLVVFFWLATATHIGAATLWPPLVALAFWVHGRRLWRQRRGLTVALGLAGLAPLVVTLLGDLIRPTDYRQSVDARLLGFAGTSLFDVGRIQEPSLSAWLALSGEGWGAGFRSLLIAAASGFVIGRHLLADHVTSRRRTALLTLLALYWGPVLAVSLLTFEQRSRYLLHVQPFGVILIALALTAITNSARSRRRGSWLTEGGMALGVVTLAVLVSATGLSDRFQHPVIAPDYVTAMQHVAAGRQPGDPVIVALPAAAYLAIDDQTEIVFLAGTEGQARVTRYTFLTGTGSTVDYWTGSTAITSPGQLCQLVQDQPGAWIVVDENRLAAGWAYRGEMARTIDRLTRQAGEAPGGVVILRPLPGDELPSCG
ncbi:MAG: hypothetical protein ACR2LS_05745 [Thermomicrobiales bacterium]